MRRMKDSGVGWIGEIPKDWEIIPTKILFDILSGATPKSDNPDFFDGDIPWITPADFKTDDKYVLCGKRNLTEKGFNSCSTSLVPSGSIVFSKRAPIGLVAISGNELSTNQGCLSCVPKRKDNVVFFYYLMSVCKEHYEVLGTGTTFKEISASVFARYPLLTPTLDEQEHIAIFLSDRTRRINALITNNETQIERLKQYKQSLITETVTRGLDPDATMKDSGVEWIGMMPESWSMRRVRDIGWTQNGISKDGRYFGNGFPFVSYGDVYRNFALPRVVSGQIESTEEERDNYSVQAGDIFFTRTSETIDETGFSSVCQATIPDAVFAGFLIRLRPYKAESIVLTDYAKYYFRGSHIRAYLTKEMNLVTRASMSQGLLKAMRVLVPPMEEQSAIAQYLDKRVSQIDTVISLKQRKIEKLKQYRQSLIYECVTGKRDLR